MRRAILALAAGVATYYATIAAAIADAFSPRRP